ncbi:Crp/Fnr family transcriptional regulator [Aureispira anguillae]|uniref:Crp/Fnr family transcriptional regulator n=1 Tax=Aureispira anguillae TaxID=2864201 RepID=A0A915YDI0_9BACT|nr:Crp/Fnr family transcriptional regulator [Aureispira anguillae]BDS11099.1 Crp/Fnr family transcriptional regulator [Aureispira anguillae]
MKQAFFDFVQQHIQLDPKEMAFMDELLPIKTFSRGDFLLQQEAISKHFFFIIKGCIRLFYVVDGIEKSAFFYTENEFVSSYESFTKQAPAKHNFQATESTQVIVISADSAYKLLAYSPKFDFLARVIMEEELSTYQNMIAAFITLNPEQRYLQFLAQKGSLINRLPQHYIASYLGVSAESLSRIKKRIATKTKKS